MTTLKLNMKNSTATRCTQMHCEKRIGRLIDNMFHISIGGEEVFISSYAKVTIRCPSGHWSEIEVSDGELRSS